MDTRKFTHAEATETVTEASVLARKCGVSIACVGGSQWNRSRDIMGWQFPRESDASARRHLRKFLAVLGFNVERDAIKDIDGRCWGSLDGASFKLWNIIGD